MMKISKKKLHTLKSFICEVKRTIVHERISEGLPWVEIVPEMMDNISISIDKDSKEFNSIIGFLIIEKTPTHYGFTNKGKKIMREIEAE